MIESDNVSNSTWLGTSRPGTARPSTARPGTAFSRRGGRSRASSVAGGPESQQIICSVSEGRGIAPVVGLAFVNLGTGEAVLSQICDTQSYVRTITKVQVFEPTDLLVVANAGPNTISTMSRMLEENVIGPRMVKLNRKYWSEVSGLEYIQNLAFKDDIEAIKVALDGNYFATCCFAAV